MFFTITTYRKHFNVLASYVLTVAILLAQLQTKATVNSSGLNFNNFSSATIYKTLVYSQSDSKASKNFALISEIIAEVNEEEEAEASNFEFDHSIKGYSIFEEHLYTACIQSQLVHLNFSVSKQRNAPLFLLHHSWKTHLA